MRGWFLVLAAALAFAADAAQGGSVEDRAAALIGDWNGEYVCNQGLTGMTLAVRAAEARGGAITLRARYIFFAIAENPELPTGCYELAGGVDAASGALTLTAGRWLRQPDGWLTVNLTGVVDFARLTMAGAVEGYNCTTFSLAKAETPAKSDDVCFAAPLYSLRNGADGLAAGAQAAPSAAR